MSIPTAFGLHPNQLPNLEVWDFVFLSEEHPPHSIYTMYEVLPRNLHVVLFHNLAVIVHSLV